MFDETGGICRVFAIYHHIYHYISHKFPTEITLNQHISRTLWGARTIKMGAFYTQMGHQKVNVPKPWPSLLGLQKSIFPCDVHILVYVLCVYWYTYNTKDIQIHIHTCTYMYTHMYIYIYIHLHTQIHRYIYIYIYIFTYISVHVYRLIPLFFVIKYGSRSNFHHEELEDFYPWIKRDWAMDQDLFS